MASDITLTAAQRTTIISLNTTSLLSDRTQVRLATGNRVNNVLDGAEEYFIARGLNHRAGTFDNRKSGIDQGISTVQTALEGIEALDNFLGQLRGIARQTRSQTVTERVESTKSFEDVLEQFTLLLDDTSYQGINLLNNSSTQLVVEFSEKNESDLEISGVNILASGGVGGSTGAIFASHVIHAAHLGALNSGNGLLRSNILNILDGFSTVADLNDLAVDSGGGIAQGFSLLSFGTNLNALDRLDEILSGAQQHLQTRSTSFASSASILQTRIDFTRGVTNHLIVGADKITSANLNEEAANLTATGARYQIGVQALGSVSQRLLALLQVIR